jgi:hypothetical protein
MDPGVELVDYNYALDYESLYANETAAPVSTNYKRRLAPSSSFSAKRKKWMKRANRAWNRIKEDLHWDVRMLLHYGKDPNVEKEPWDYAVSYIPCLEYFVFSLRTALRFL